MAKHFSKKYGVDHLTPTSCFQVSNKVSPLWEMPYSAKGAEEGFFVVVVVIHTYFL